MTVEGAVEIVHVVPTAWNATTTLAGVGLPAAGTVCVFEPLVIEVAEVATSSQSLRLTSSGAEDKVWGWWCLIFYGKTHTKKGKGGTVAASGFAMVISLVTRAIRW